MQISSPTLEAHQKAIIKAKIDHLTDEAQLKAIEVVLDAMLVEPPRDLKPDGSPITAEDISEWRRAADEVFVHGRGIPQAEMEAMYNVA